MVEQGYSLSTLLRERDELRHDLIAFTRAYDILCQRVRESNELPIQRRPLLHEWSGSRAVVGSLEMAIHAIERTIEGTNEIINQIRNGDLRDTDPVGHPGLGVVDGGKSYE